MIPPCVWGDVKKQTNLFNEGIYIRKKTNSIFRGDSCRFFSKNGQKEKKKRLFEAKTIIFSYWMLLNQP